MSTTEPGASNEPQLIAGWLETSGGLYAGYYTREPDTAEPVAAGPALVCPCGIPDVHLDCGLLCRTCAATVAEEADGAAS